MTLAAAAPAPRVALADTPIVLIATFVFLLGSLALTELISLNQAVLFLIGGLMGATLFHASFGFTGGWRKFVNEGRGNSIRAQMLMVGLATLAFIPLLALGEVNGQRLVGAFAPVGVSVVFGATLFGLGMQLGGGCGSGTLFTVGGGSRRMLVTLVFFIIGALIGTLHLPAWLALPSLPPVNLGQSLGVFPAIAVTLLALAGVAALTYVLERRRHGGVQNLVGGGWPKGAGWLHGTWPLAFGALALAVLNIATLLVAGHPWSITAGFGLWGAKVASAIGVPVEQWAFWQVPAQARALNDTVLADTVSVMDFGIMLGAALAAGLAGKFAPKAALPFKSLLAAILGGLMMGYGARLSFGCNIGALFSGIASGSLHGWLWFACAFGGSLIGIRIRPWFGFDEESKK
jgi:uncharacterized membrane protein YedE/YeeE